MDITIRLATLLRDHRVAWLNSALDPLWTDATNGAAMLAINPTRGKGTWGRVVIFSEKDYDWAVDLLSPQGLIVLLTTTTFSSSSRPILTPVAMWQSNAQALICLCRAQDLEHSAGAPPRPVPLGFVARWNRRLLAILRNPNRMGASGILKTLRRLAQIDSVVMRQPGFYADQMRGLAGKQDFGSHFLTLGAVQRLNPSPSFDTIAYLQDNPDVAHAGANPLLHYLEHGKDEGRRVTPVREHQATFGVVDAPLLQSRVLLGKTGLDLLRANACLKPSSEAPTAQNEGISPPFSIIVTGAERPASLKHTLDGLRGIYNCTSLEITPIRSSDLEDLVSAIEAASNDRVLVLSAGLVPTYGTLEAAAARLDDGTEVVTGRILDHRGALLDPGGIKRGRCTPSLARFADPGESRFATAQPVRTICTAFLALRRDQPGRWRSLFYAQSPSDASDSSIAPHVAYEPRSIAVSCTQSPPHLERLSFPSEQFSNRSANEARPSILMIAQRFLRPNGCAESGARAALLADLKRLNYDITVAYTSPLHANAAQNWLGLHGIAIHPFCYDAQVDQFIRYNRRRFSEIIAIDRVKGEWADSLCFCHRTHKSPTPLSLRALVSTMTHALPMMQGLAGDPKDHAQNIAVAWVDRTDCDFWRNTIARLTEAHNNQLSARIALSGPGAIELATSLAPNARQHCIFLAPTAHIGALLSRSQFLAVSSDKALWIRQIARAEKVPALILPPDDAKAAILLAHFERSETARKTALALDIPYVAEMTSLKATKARLFSLLTSDRQRDKPIERATTAC